MSVRFRSLGSGLLMGVLAAPVSLLLMLQGLPHGIPDPPGDLSPLYSLVLLVFCVVTSLVLAIFFTRMVSAGSAVSAMVTCLLGMSAGYGLLVLWFNLAVQTVEYVNETSQPLIVYYAREFEPWQWPLGPNPLEAGRSHEQGNIPRMGSWLRIVAQRLDGKRVFDRTYTWSELGLFRSRVVFASDDPLPGPP